MHSLGVASVSRLFHAGMKGLPVKRKSLGVILRYHKPAALRIDCACNAIDRPGHRSDIDVRFNGNRNSVVPCVGAHGSSTIIGFR
jgi:hypothetical protein